MNLKYFIYSFCEFLSLVEAIFLIQKSELDEILVLDSLYKIIRHKRYQIEKWRIFLKYILSVSNVFFLFFLSCTCQIYAVLMMTQSDVRD